jgi:hypothetical protein
VRRTRHQPDPEAERARHALRVVISLSLVSRRVIQQRLVAADAGTDISRVLSGRLELRVRHITGVCRILGLPPAEFFAMTYPKPPEPSELMVRLRTLLGPLAHTGRRHDGPQVR